MAFLIQFAVSLLAVAALVGLAAWARIARHAPPLDEAHARAVMGEEFPGRAVEALWLAQDGETALARSGGDYLLLRRAGDGYVARRGPLAQLSGGSANAAVLHPADTLGGAIRVKPGAAPWPPFPVRAGEAA